MKVFCHWNLTKKTWSILCEEKGHPKKGLVVAHRDNVLLTSVSPKISQAGRRRVLRDKQKNVHAGLVGTWHDVDYKAFQQTGEDITYNPYKYETFVFCNDDTIPYNGSSIVWLNGRRAIACGITENV